MHTELASLHCPYCGELIELILDPSGAGMSGETGDYIEDCSVCCRPMVVSTWQQSDGGLGVAARREDE